MKFRAILLLALATVLVGIGGCRSTGVRGENQGSEASTSSEDGQPVTKVKSITGDFDGEIIGTIRPKSKFAKLSIGMSRRQVDDLIGQPTDQSSHISGKAFIPFYFGRDAYRTEYYYVKEGRLIYAAGGAFSQGERLLKIVADANESGYAR